MASGTEIELAEVFGQKGHGYVVENASIYSQAATATSPLLVILDQENKACAPTLVEEMYPSGVPEHTLIGISVRMSEAWLMGDKEGLASFLGITANRFPDQPETVEHPKRTLLNIIQRHGRGSFKQKFVRENGATQGPEYFSEVAHFVREQWNIARARRRCPSLDRLVNRISELGN